MRQVVTVVALSGVDRIRIESPVLRWDPFLDRGPTRVLIPVRMLVVVWVPLPPVDPVLVQSPVCLWVPQANRIPVVASVPLPIRVLVLLWVRLPVRIRVHPLTRSLPLADFPFRV